MSIGYFMIMPNDSQLKLRLPSDLKQKIEEIAESEKRSMNAEIVARLENSFNFQKKIRPLIQYQRSFVRIFISAPDPVIKGRIRQSGSCGPLHGEH